MALIGASYSEFRLHVISGAVGDLRNLSLLFIRASATLFLVSERSSSDEDKRTNLFLPAHKWATCASAHPSEQCCAAKHSTVRRICSGSFVPTHGASLRAPCTSVLAVQVRRRAARSSDGIASPGQRQTARNGIETVRSSSNIEDCGYLTLTLPAGPENST